EAGHGAGLASEPRAALFLAREEGVQHLDGDVSVEGLVPPSVDDAHAALTDHLEHAIVQEATPDHGIGSPLHPARRVIACELEGARHALLIPQADADPARGGDEARAEIHLAILADELLE